MQLHDAIINLLLKQPFYGHIASSITFHRSSQIEQMRIVTSPHPQILYNEEWYLSLDKNEAIGVIIHELLHLVLLHNFRRGSRERKIWTIACDMAVNEHIHPDLLPENFVTVKKIQQELKQQFEPQKSAEFYYDTLSEFSDSISFIQRDDQVSILLGGGIELVAETLDESSSAEIDQKTVSKMISDMVSDASEDGETPEGLTGYIKDNFQTFRVNWRNVLKRFLSGTGRMSVQKTFKKPSRRYDNMPGSKRTIGLRALLAIDESGSISSSEVESFFSEVMKIKRITGAEVTVTQFDTTCTNPVAIERYIRDKRRIKGGGTDFRPVFQMSEKMRIPLVIVFTDGDGKLPEKVSQKVLWVLTREPKKSLPFGHQIVFEK